MKSPTKQQKLLRAIQNTLLRSVSLCADLILTTVIATAVGSLSFFSFSGFAAATAIPTIAAMTATAATTATAFAK